MTCQYNYLFEKDDAMSREAHPTMRIGLFVYLVLIELSHAGLKSQQKIKIKTTRIQTFTFSIAASSCGGFTTLVVTFESPNAPQNAEDQILQFLNSSKT